MKIVRVTALWCMSCLVMKKVWKKVLESSNTYDIVDLDVDFDHDKVQAYQIGKTLPVLIVFKGDREIGRLVGEMSAKELQKKLEVLYETD